MSQKNDNLELSNEEISSLSAGNFGGAAVKSELNGIINTVGLFISTIYLWYLWGQSHDFIRWGFLGYIILFSILTAIPKAIITKIFCRDGIFSKMEQLMSAFFNIGLVYFLAPIIIGWLN